jgi:hypothetical protein
MTIFKSWWFRLYVLGCMVHCVLTGRRGGDPLMTGHNVIKAIAGFGLAFCYPGYIFSEYFGFTAGDTFVPDGFAVAASSLVFWLLLALALKIARMIRTRRGRSDRMPQAMPTAGGWIRQRTYTIEED